MAGELQLMADFLSLGDVVTDNNRQGNRQLVLEMAVITV